MPFDNYHLKWNPSDQSTRQFYDLLGKTADDNNFNSYVESIKLIRSLIDASSGIFTGLLDNCGLIQNRINLCSTRISRMVDQELSTTKSPSKVLSEIPSSSAGSSAVDFALLERTSAPKPIIDLYNSRIVSKLPSIHLLDRFKMYMKGDAASSSRSLVSAYSDPAFFFEAWKAQELNKQNRAGNIRQIKRANSARAKGSGMGLFRRKESKQIPFIEPIEVTRKKLKLKMMQEKKQENMSKSNSSNCNEGAAVAKQRRRTSILGTLPKSLDDGMYRREDDDEEEVSGIIRRIEKSKNEKSKPSNSSSNFGSSHKSDSRAGDSPDISPPGSPEGSPPDSPEGSPPEFVLRFASNSTPSFVSGGSPQSSPPNSPPPSDDDEPEFNSDDEPSFSPPGSPPQSRPHSLSSHPPINIFISDNIIDNKPRPPPSLPSSNIIDTANSASKKPPPLPKSSASKSLDSQSNSVSKPPPPKPMTKPEEPPPAPSPAALDPDDPFYKYHKMKTMLPEGAVRQKMMTDGFSDAEIQAFFEGTTAAPSANKVGGPTSPPPPPSLPKKDINNSDNESKPPPPPPLKKLSLMDSIKAGNASLKRTTPNDEKPVSAQSGMLAAIKAGAQLKKVSDTKRNSLKVEGGGKLFESKEVSAILARRKYLENTEESSSDEGEWD